MNTQERIRIVLLMAKLESVTLVERQLRKEGVYPIPTKKHMRTIYHKFKETGSVHDLPRSGRPSIPEEKVEEIKEIFSSNPSTSLKRAYASTGIPCSSVHKILHEKLNMMPYKMSHLQQLFDSDRAARTVMCTELLNSVSNDESFLSKICFSDEATFHLHGRVNRHNCVIWGTENPKAVHEIPIKSPKVTVWCGLTNKEIIGPYFFENNVESQSYQTMLETFFVPQLKSRRIYRKTIFQQDGAPAHWSLSVREFLNQTFPGRWIGRDGPIQWAARSPDLSPLDFYLWGFIKDRVYGRKPKTLNQIRQFITEEIRSISSGTLEAVFKNWVCRLEKCKEQNGSHLEHLL